MGQKPIKPYVLVLITIGLIIVYNTSESIFIQILYSQFGFKPVDNYEWSSSVFLILSFTGVFISFRAYKPDFKWTNNTFRFQDVVAISIISILIRILGSLFEEFYSVWLFHVDGPPLFETEIKAWLNYSETDVFILPILILPIFTEVIFRGMVFQILLKNTARLKAFLLHLLCYLIFVYYFYDPTQGILLGILCGVIYLKSRSIYLSILSNYLLSFCFMWISAKTTLIMAGEQLFIGTNLWITTITDLVLMALLIFILLKYLALRWPTSQVG